MVCIFIYILCFDSIYSYSISSYYCHKFGNRLPFCMFMIHHSRAEFIFRLLGNLKLYFRFINSSQLCDGVSRSYLSPMKTRAYLAYTVNMVTDKTIQGISSHGIDAVWPEYSGFHTKKLILWDCGSGFISYQHVCIETITVSGAKSYRISCL